MRGFFFGIVWLFVRFWRGVSAVVGPVMRKASDLAMMPYDGAERGYLKLLPGALRKPWLVLGLAASAFVGTMMLVPLLGVLAVCLIGPCNGSTYMRYLYPVIACMPFAIGATVTRSDFFWF